MSAPSLTTSEIDEAVEYVELPPSDLMVDDEYQRVRRTAKVERMVRTFDREQFGAIEVNMRQDGTYFVIDGQHRLACALARGMEWVWCRMHYGLTQSGEADLYVRLNRDRSRVTTIEEFRAALVASEPEATAIDAALREHALTVGSHPRDGVISAVAALRSIYRRVGGLGLSTVLRVSLDAWPADDFGRTGHILRAIGVVLARYPEINVAKLAGRLARHTPHNLAATGRARAGTGDPTVGIASTMVDAYNWRTPPDARLDPQVVFTRGGPGSR